MLVQRGPGRLDRWRLAHRVRAATGPAAKFLPLEHQFAEWTDLGSTAPPAVLGTVEPYLAGYLDAAAEAGRDWGKTTGIVCGAVLGFVAFVLALVVT